MSEQVVGESIGEMKVEVGDAAEFQKTFTEADTAFFSAISGDFDPIHVSETFAGATVFGRRIAHGLAVLALMSAPESELSKRITGRGCKLKPISLGYDDVRFVKPVFVGDTLTASYRIVAIDAERRRAVGRCEVSNQDGDVCLVGNHIMKWVSAG